VNHTDIVASVKADLERRGVNLTGPDGAFEITKRVAWQLRGEGAGLLDKPGGNNAHGFATDIICYPTGQIFDVLVSGGDVNGPAWQDAGAVDPARYRPAIDPGDEQAKPPAPPPDEPPASEVLIDAIERLIGGVSAIVESNTALEQRLKGIQENGIRVHF
jgi:hypothetical protein